MKKLNTKAVIFDYDGTLTYGDYNNIWKSLYQVLGYETDRNSEYYLSYVGFKNYKYDYDRWVQINEEDFKRGGLTKKIFDSVTEDIKFIKGLEKVIKNLHKKGVKLFVLSGNFKYAIEKTLGKLSDYFTEISANEIYFSEDGALSQIVATKFDFEGKPKFITKVQQELQIEPHEICFVGNGENDAFAYKSGAKTICVNPVDADEDDAEKWTHVLKNVTNLTKILDCID